ncbi:wall-associated receptor kinase-like 18 [Brassica napus]|uniref:wall-associated receptor kinase-like 18 n=1 Tax=Brassica napus TaxID=3708 RepID=UPI0020785A74|nr:wall-associated receptor kinase-like 18 [Brassica napus]XP_048636688.1 wall-associated receptor kinase-like 18 [Brassica napus]
MSDENTKCSILLILLKVLLLLILYSEDVAASSSCQSQCGGVTIQYPFGIGKGCYLEKSYEIKCLSSTTSGKLAPFLYITDNNREVVNISLPEIEAYSPNEPLYLLSFGSVRVKIPITSSGCGVKESPESLLNFTGTPFFIDYQNSLVAVGSNAKVSLTHVEPNIVGCELTSNTGKYQSSNSVPFLKNTQCLASSQSYLYGACPLYNEDVKECNGSGCCKVGLREHQQAIGIRIESNDSTTTREEKCRVAFLTIESYTSSNATNPQELFDKGYATLSLGWVIQTKNHSFVSSLSCDNRDVYENTTYAAVSQRKCICGKSTIAKISYAHCSCKRGYTGNAYDPHGCQDVNECKTEHISCEGMNTCVNTEGGHHCAGDKKKAILIGLGSGFGALALVSGVWWLRKFLIKRRMTKQKNKFFKRNGGLLLQQQLYTRDGNVETTKIFSSGELEKATENFSENRVLGQGGQGTVYKGMLVDGSTVAVKKSKIIDEDKLQEFINEVVILSQINHRHIVKLLGCCLETEVPILVYEFILNGNLFQHIHEESDDYSMIWGMRLRIAVDVAGALSYLHSSASSPIYHRDIKSTNILLDEKHRAKVADFGTSRSITIDQTHWTTVVSGTVGYVDPEYYRSSQFTEKSDVYSFGVVLAELITGDKPVVTIQNTRETISLSEHFKLAVKKKRLSDVMDARIKEDCKMKQVMAVANLAVKCLSSKGNKRPNMREVFTELERISASPEDSHVQVMIDEDEDEEDEEEEVTNMVNRGNSLRVGLTAPALGIVASPSSSNAESLIPRPTW